MPFTIASLWQAPDINSVSSKARAIPFFNVFNLYGRVLFLSWFGFFIAFWGWYAFPPLLTVTIKKDLNLSQADIANSNILGLVATLLVRLAAGSLCDRFGARWTFAGILLLGAIPTALAGTIKTAGDLLAVRFFLGILGGSFIPCQVWTSGFFDKNVVGTANALTAGLGNAGSGVTYFVMPAVFESLVHAHDIRPHIAWKVTFVIPFVVIVVTAIFMILTCPDTPTGSWSSRRRDVQRQLDTRDTYFTTMGETRKHSSSPDVGNVSNDTLKLHAGPIRSETYGVQSHEDDLLAAASWELVEEPTYHGTAKALLSLPTITLVVCYLTTFGAELAVNSILGAYYFKNFDSIGQTGSGNWAAMFGLLNAVFRPAGGAISDFIYRLTGSLWAKKIWMHVLGFMTGLFLVIIGVLDPKSVAVMIGLSTGMAFFLEGANGACFSLVPHVHCRSNGLITGVTGAAGDLGGIIFLLIFRFEGDDYARAFWVTGILIMALQLTVSWISPIPRDQLGGR